jgi:hypothetical protein
VIKFGHIILILSDYMISIIIYIPVFWRLFNYNDMNLQIYPLSKISADIIYEKID